MATIGTLAVNVVARTGQLRSGLNRGRSHIRGFTSSANRATGAMGGLSSGLAKAGAAAAAAAAAFVAAKRAIAGVRAEMERIDTLAKTADKLGVTTTQLVQLRHAAELSGVAANTFDMALQRMTRRVAEAAKGTGEAKDALLELGLNAQQLSQAGPAAAMLKIADAMKGVENQSDRVRLAFKLFDSEGVSLVNTLARGSQGMLEAAKGAKFLGITINRVDSKAIENANDAVTRLKSAFQGLMTQLAILFAPLIETVSKILTDFVANLAKVVGKLAELTGSKSLGQLEAGLNKAAEGIKKLKAPIDQSTESFDKLAEAQKAMIERGKEIERNVMTPVERFSERITELKNLASIAAIQWQTYDRAVKAATEDLRRAADAQKRFNQAAKSEGVAAVTRGTSASFSASQASVRQNQDRKIQIALDRERNKILERQLEEQKKEKLKVNVVDI